MAPNIAAVLVTLGLLAALTISPLQSQAELDPDATAIAQGVQSFAGILDGLDGLEELAHEIPFTDVQPTGDEGLRLAEVFAEALENKLAGRLENEGFESIAALQEFLNNAIDGEFSGVAVHVESTIAPNGALFDVTLILTLTRSDSTAFLFSDGDVDIANGSLTTTFSLYANLAFQFDPAEPIAEEKFYLLSDPGPVIEVDFSAVATFNGGDAFDINLGFTEVTVAHGGDLPQSVDIGALLTAAIIDPGVDGWITQDEWQATAPGDLFDVGFASSHAFLDIDMTTPLIPGVTATIDLNDADISVLDAPAVSLGSIADLSNIDTDLMLSGLTQLAAALLASQAAGDLTLPFTNARLSEAFQIDKELTSFIRSLADAAIVCGTEDTDPPTGDISNLPPDADVWCQAVAPQNPVSVTWGIDGGTVASKGTAADTVGTNPTSNVKFLLPSGGRPIVTVDFTDPDLEDGIPGADHTVGSRFLNVQELETALQAALGVSSVFVYDPATKALTFDISFDGDPDDFVDGMIDFGDQLKDDTRVFGLSPRVSEEGPTPTPPLASLIVDPEFALDVTFGVLLVDDPADITPGDDDVFPTGESDRFFIQVDNTPGEFEFTANASVVAEIELDGTLGFLEVSASGDAARNPVDAEVLVIATAVPGNMLSLNIDAPAAGIPVAGSAAVLNAIRIREFLGSARPGALGVADNVTVDCNVRMSAGINVSARISGSELASGGVGIDWPDVFGDDCNPDFDVLSVTADATFNSELLVFDFSTENPAALLSLVLDNLDAIAAGLEALGVLDDKELPLLGLSVGDLLGQLQNLQTSLDTLRTGGVGAGVIMCGTDDDPLTGDATLAAQGDTIFCQGVVSTPPATVQWSISGGDVVANDDEPMTVGTVNSGPTLSAEFEITHPQGDFRIELAGDVTAEFPAALVPASLQQLETEMEALLNLPAGALEIKLADVDEDGDQELLLEFEYGVCTTGYEPPMVSLSKLKTPLTFDAGPVTTLDNAVLELVGLVGAGEVEAAFSSIARFHFGIDISDFDIKDPAASFFLLDSTMLDASVALSMQPRLLRTHSASTWDHSH